MKSDLSCKITFFTRWLFILGVFWLVKPCLLSRAEAQLAGNFSNLTGITVTRLPNAVQVRIETDGTIKFGGDFNDWVDTKNGWGLKPTTSVRLRIVQTRAKLPAYVPIDAYPIDGAVISLGQTDFVDSYFSDNAGPNDNPRVDVELRFATPVIIRKFTVEPWRSTWFGDYVGPKEASIELANDRRSILITVIPDRSDLRSAEQLDRSPVASRPKHLSVTAAENSQIRVESLHTPLRDVLGELSKMTGQKFAARKEVQDLDVSLFLNGNIAEILSTLGSTYNLGFRFEDGALVLGSGDEFFEARSFPLNSIAPDKARLMLPDFLLPFLRADSAQNALLAFQTPNVLNKIGRDLKVIDAPRAQFEITAQVWEILIDKDSNFVLNLLRSLGGDRQNLDSDAGVVTVQVAPNQTDQLLARLSALQSRSAATLLGAPRVSALSGATGSLFLGQTRYVKILRQDGANQIAQAIPLQIGTELRVTPRGSNLAGDPISVDITPRVATVDQIENVTGLPTLGIREFSSSLRMNPNDAILLAGLDTDLNFETDRKLAQLIPSKLRNRERHELIALVWARRIPTPVVAENQSPLTAPIAPDQSGEIR